MSPLPTADVLESMYSMTPATLGMTPEAYNVRLILWEKQAEAQAQAAGVPTQAAVYARILALRAWAIQLMGQADEFRAEGDITVKRDVLGRIALVDAWLKEAQAELPPIAVSAASRQRFANPAPEFGEWGLR